MTRRIFLFTGLVALGLIAVAADCNPTIAQKKTTPTATTEDPRRLAQEVAALQTLYYIQLSPKQLLATARLCKDTATAQGPPTQIKVSAKFRKALTDLRTALITDQDERVSDLNSKLDKLFDDENVEIDDRMPINDAARRKAPELAKLLYPSQVAFLIADIDNDSLDPFDRIVDTVEAGRKLPAAAWQKVRDDVAEEIAWLIAGSNISEARTAHKKVAALLDRQRKLSPAAFEANLDALEQESDTLLAHLNPFDVLRHAVERELAELLSNPQLPAALQARLQAAKK